jgi:hypothetical protein
VNPGGGIQTVVLFRKRYTLIAGIQIRRDVDYFSDTLRKGPLYDLRTIVIKTVPVKMCVAIDHY